jgi:pilus assembly protein FimV
LLVLKDQKLAMIEKALKAKKEGKAIPEDTDLKNTEDALNKAQAVADAAKQATNGVAKKDTTQPIDLQEKTAAIAKAKADAEAKAQADAKAKAAALQAENEAKAAKAKADAEAKAQADAKAKADAAALKAKTEADAAAAKAKIDAEAKAKAANSAPITPKPEDTKAKVDTAAKMTAANSAPTSPKPEDAKAVADAAAAKAKADADTKAKADAAALKAKTEADAAAAKAKADLDAKVKADADAKAKADAAALKAKTEADTAAAKAKADLDAKVKADAAMAKAKADADAKAKADAAALKAKTDAAAAKAKADAEAKAKAEAAKAKIEAATAELKAKAAAKLQADAEAKAKAKAEAAKADSPEPEVMPIHPKPLITEPKPVEAEESWMPDPYILSVAGGGVVAIGLLGWLFWRKRKVESVSEVESMFTESSEISLPDDEDEFSVAGIEDNSSFMFGGESSFLSDDNDFDAFEVDQDEVDPISEADVYLAYGRYQQAEELMRQAIEEQPNRDECKLKLLEIFYANENAAAFEAYVTDLAGAGKAANKVFWSKVVEMGRGIIPDSPLLDVSAEDESVEEIAEQGNQAIDPDNFEVSDFESAMTEGFTDVAEQTDDAKSSEQRISLEKSEDNQEDINDSTEFDLSVFDEKQPITEEAFDLSMFDEPESEPVAEKAISESVTEVPANNVEFDLSMFDEPEPVAEQAVSEPEPPANNVEFDLSMFDEPEPVAEKAVSEPEPPANNVEFDLSMFDEPEPVAEQAVSEPELPANNVEFDLSMFDEPEPVAEQVVSEPELPANNVEFDLSMFNELPPVANKVVNEPVVSEPVANDLAMFDEVGAFSTSEEDDFDLSEFETADPGKEGINLDMAEAIIKEDEDAFDLSSFDVSEDEGVDVAGFDATELNSENENFDFSAFESAEEKTASTSTTDEAEAKDNEALLDLSTFDASFDISEDDFFNTNVKSGLILDDAQLATGLADNEPFDLTEMNVLETKIDLAKAYIDMGDADAAKGILNKVLGEGTDEQKLAAASLLQNLK